MKKFYITALVIVLISNSLFAQNILTNGSFEINSATVNSLDLTYNWADTIQGSWEVDGGSMDLITTNSCADPSDGNWFVSTSPQSGLWPYLAFSFKFSSPLYPGVAYLLSFDKIFCGPNTSPIDIGLSNDSTFIGTALHTFSAPLSGNWATDTFSFTASTSSKYLTVNVGATGTTGVIGLDNFILTTNFPASLTQSFLNEKISFKNPVSDFLKINFQNSSGKKKIVLMDISGRIIQTIFSENENEISIDVKNISAGIYFLKLNDFTNSKVIISK